jgi:hypothetical protein
MYDHIFGVIKNSQFRRSICTFLEAPMSIQHLNGLASLVSQAKHKVFFCLLLQDRLNTRGLLHRKNLALEPYTYELCLHHRTETLRHLFLCCPFAKICWSAVDALLPTWLRADHATAYLRRASNKPFAMEIIIVMCWSIWKERNA